MGCCFSEAYNKYLVIYSDIHKKSIKEYYRLWLLYGLTTHRRKSGLHRYIVHREICLDKETFGYGYSVLTQKELNRALNENWKKRSRELEIIQPGKSNGSLVSSGQISQCSPISEPRRSER